MYSQLHGGSGSKALVYFKLGIEYSSFDFLNDNIKSHPDLGRNQIKEIVNFLSKLLFLFPFLLSRQHQWLLFELLLFPSGGHSRSHPPAFPYCFCEIRPSAVESEWHARQQVDLMLPHPCRVCWTDRWTNGSMGRDCGGSESGWLTFLRLGVTPGLVSSLTGSLGECFPAVHLLPSGPSWSRCTGCRRLLATEDPGSPCSWSPLANTRRR